MKTRTLSAGSNLKHQSGFTYLVIMAALVTLGITAEIVTRSEHIRIKRDQEQELLFRGMAYQRAIKSYVNANPQAKQFPRHLDDLMKDPRFAHRQHIRQVYKDPITDSEWILIKDKTGAITGVISSSKEKPLKQKFFPQGYASFEDAESYSDWIFDYHL